MRALMAFGLLSACLAVPAAAAQEPFKDKTVCKKDRSFNTGSHLSKPPKICMKASEWRELEDESQRNVDKLRERRGTARTPDASTSAGGG